MGIRIDGARLGVARARHRQSNLATPPQRASIASRATCIIPSDALACRLHRPLGQGGFGLVFKVRLIDEDMLLAGKRFDVYAGQRQRRELEKQMRREFRALRKLLHPNIVRLVGVVLDNREYVALLMELCDRGGLRS